MWQITRENRETKLAPRSQQLLDKRNWLFPARGLTNFGFPKRESRNWSLPGGFIRKLLIEKAYLKNGNEQNRNSGDIAAARILVHELWEPERRMAVNCSSIGETNGTPAMNAPSISRH